MIQTATNPNGISRERVKMRAKLTIEKSKKKS